MSNKNKYDIDEQFLNGAWTKMRQRLDKELPVKKPLYFKKLWYTSLAAMLLLFSGYHFYKLKNAEISSNNVSLIEDNKEQFILPGSKNVVGESVSPKLNNRKEEVNAAIKKENILLKEEVLASDKTKSADLMKTSTSNSNNSSTVPNLISVKSGLSTKTGSNTKMIDSHLMHTDKIVETDQLQLNIQTNVSQILVPNLSGNSVSIKNLKDINKENLDTNDIIVSSTIQAEDPAAEVNQVVSKSNAIDLLPLIASYLNEHTDTDVEIVTSLTDTPFRKIWKPKKQMQFGINLGLNSNIKDVSGVRAGLYTNYRFSKKFMLGLNLGYAYTAINTKYKVKYYIDVPASEIQGIPDPSQEEGYVRKSIIDEINYNTNHQGIYGRLALSYFPVKRLGIGAGAFATRYVFSNSKFDFLEANSAYQERALSANYGFNPYSAGPLFELQYWVKPKLNITATFEMNLIPEIKQEFFAFNSKQNYLSNSLSLALQYQFN